VDVTTGKVASHLPSDLGGLEQPTFSPNGRLLAGLEGRRYISEPCVVALWHVASGERRPWPGGGEALGFCLAFTADGQALAVGGASAVTIHDLTGSSDPVTLPREGRASAAALACSPDGQSLALSVDGGRVFLWDLPSRSPRATWQATAPKLIGRSVSHGHRTWLAFSPDGGHLATTDREVVRFWDVAGGEEVAACRWHAYEVTALAFSPDGRWLATGASDGAIKLWPWRALLE
jgi:WD40 repeat protein